MWESLQVELATVVEVATGVLQNLLWLPWAHPLTQNLWSRAVVFSCAVLWTHQGL